MKKGSLFLSVAAISMLAGSALANPSTVNFVATPDQVPDEDPPRVNLGDAPAGWGPDSWQGPAGNKTNWHARYGADGDILSILFPTQAATLKISDLASISYFTKRPTGTAAGRDWWIQIYTRPDGVNDARTWYGYKFTNNYNDHTATDAWTEYSTDSGMTFNLDGNSTEHSLASLSTNYGSELIEMISIQTDSGWDGFDGYLDGLTITLNDGSVANVNFEAVPAPAAAFLAFFGLGIIGWIKRKIA